MSLNDFPQQEDYEDDSQLLWYEQSQQEEEGQPK